MSGIITSNSILPSFMSFYMFYVKIIFLLFFQILMSTMMRNTPRPSYVFFTMWNWEKATK